MQTATGRVLLVDDDPSLLKLLGLRLRAFGHDVKSVESSAAALSAVETFHPQTVITDLRMNEMDGLHLLDEIHRKRPGLPVLIITAHGTIPDAVNATREGAFCFLTKPVDKAVLQAEIAKALRNSAPAYTQDNSQDEIISCSAVMSDLLARAHRVAQSDTSVLLTGDSGTGKELLARAIHKASPRAAQAFVAVNCGAIPEHLLESELFGHERGAFTSAMRSHKGLFQAADGGTLFLDEIGDMPTALQIKLLRALQDGEVRRVGSTKVAPVDVRVISATNHDLPDAIARGRFREDLFYRLNVVCLQLPPLSERREDIPLLVTHFLERLAQKRHEVAKVYAPQAMDTLMAAAWPGNVRQLYNAVEQNVVLSPTRIISVRTAEQALGREACEFPSYAEARDEFTREYLTRLLKMTNGNAARAARLAKRNRTDFYRLLARFQLDPGGFKAKSMVSPNGDTEN